MHAVGTMWPGDIWYTQRKKHSQCLFVHHKSQRDQLGIEPSTVQWRALWNLQNRRVIAVFTKVCDWHCDIVTAVGRWCVQGKFAGDSRREVTGCERVRCGLDSTGTELKSRLRCINERNFVYLWSAGHQLGLTVQLTFDRYMNCLIG